MHRSHYVNVLCLPIAADPVVFITEEIIYALEGSAVEIRAAVSSSDLNSLVVEWYHEGSLINVASDSRYSLRTEGMGLRILSIASVGTDTLGRYEAVITIGNRNQTDTVLLAFPG